MVSIRNCRTDSPIEKLVVSQLSALSRCEKRLDERLALLKRNPNAQAAEAWAYEALTLRLRANRLERMIDAFNGVWTDEPAPEDALDPIAA